MKKKKGVSMSIIGKEIRRLMWGIIVISLILPGCSLLPREEAPQPAPEPPAQPKDVQVKETLGWVSEINLETGLLAFDDLEWITSEDTERIEELGLAGDFPNDFYLHNEVELVEWLPVAEQATVWLLDWDDLANPVNTDVQGLADFLEERGSLFRLTTENDVIVDVFEVYTP